MSAFSSRSANPPKKISIETEYLTGNFSATKKLKDKNKKTLNKSRMDNIS